ncbi:class I SAM-dependent rRNA methyltransferase [Ampullimonas aquatilis]|uniref:class I SAM-dependent rRNA methyltransferase n=1 Tax=Ampullimonas aquatilis TaxID=1341549 RepID=UPI003C73C698
MNIITLKPGKEKSLLRRHPWVFSGAIAKGGADAGSTVAVHAHDGRFLALGACSPQSNIRVRVWSFDDKDRIDATFFAQRVATALALRQPLLGQSRRLIHGEADGLPGLVVDHYHGLEGDWLVLQSGATGVEKWKAVIVDELVKQTGITNVFERSDADVRSLEGLPVAIGVLAGVAPPERLTIEESGIQILIDITGGHKTGFYLDQRDNRRAVARQVAQLAQTRGSSASQPLTMLNCFCFSGGFSLAAAKATPFLQITSIDSAQSALDLATLNANLNGVSSQCEWACDDVFKALRAYRDAQLQFDVIILDPPKFAPTAAHVERAARAYKDINLIACKLLKPGGLLFTYSCSGGVTADLFQKIVAGAASDAGSDMLILERLAAGPDHPLLLAFPEGEYLKGLALQKI